MKNGIRSQIAVVLAATSLAIYLGSQGSYYYAELRFSELLGTIFFICTWLWAAYVSGKRRAGAFLWLMAAYWLLPSLAIVILDAMARYTAASGVFFASVRLLFSYFIFTTIYAVVYLTENLGLSNWIGVAVVAGAIILFYFSGRMAHKRFIFDAR